MNNHAKYWESKQKVEKMLAVEKVDSTCMRNCTKSWEFVLKVKRKWENTLKFWKYQKIDKEAYKAHLKLKKYEEVN